MLKPLTRSGPIAIVLVLALLALPGGASARSKHFIETASSEATFELQASNGYRVSVTAFGQQGTELFAEKGNAAATYEVKGGLTADNGIEAKFPGVGRVSVKFKPSGPARKVHRRDCKGRDELVRRGVFRGTIGFEGEGGFTKVEAGSARGTVLESFKQVCNVGSGGVHIDSEFSLLAAAAKHGSEDLDFSASTLVSHSKPKFAIATIDVNLGSERHGMSVNKSVSSLAHVNLLKLTGPDGRLQSALVTPPPPFTGTGSFELTSKTSATWTGTLSVEFPGIGPLSLAGPEFTSTLCVETHCVPKFAGPFERVSVARREARAAASSALARR
jgi:hypothetical protein